MGDTGGTLDQAGAAATSDRARAIGNELVELHRWLRDELRRLDGELADGATLTTPLRAHCLTVCTALSRHHVGENAGVFGLIKAQFPQLRPAIAMLQEDHAAIAAVLQRIVDLLGALSAGTTDIAQVRTELRGLTAIVESHFAYEERQIVAALNSVQSDLPTERLLGLSAPKTD